MEFARANQKAMLLLHTATGDYAAARCLLLNGLFAGLAIGSQAIEKYLKASILLAEPSYKLPNTHNLVALLQEAERRIPELIPLRMTPIAQHFLECYRTRYPDNPGQPSSMDTGKIGELDAMVVGINMLLPCPRNSRMRSGLFAAVTFSLNRLCTPTPTERWIKEANAALGPVWDRIKDDYFEAMRAIYPQSPELHS